MAGVTATYPTDISAAIASGGLDGATDDNISPEVWDRLISAIRYGFGTNGTSGYAGPRGNLLVNGGFEIAQRGTGAFTANNAYTMDRWRITLATSTVSVTQITSTIGTKGKSAQIAYTHAGGGSVIHAQSLSPTAGEYIQLLGKTVTLSVKVKSTVIGTIRLRINDDVTGSTYSAYNTGTAEETLTVTATISATATSISIGAIMDVATATAEVNDAMLTIGSVAADYQQLTPAEDLARCHRYARKIGGDTTRHRMALGGATGSTGGILSIFWTPEMATTPTVTFTAANTFAVVDGAGSEIAATVISADNLNKQSGSINVTVAAGLTAGRWTTLYSNATTNGYIIAEANP